MKKVTILRVQHDHEFSTYFTKDKPGLADLFSQRSCCNYLTPAFFLTGKSCDK